MGSRVLRCAVALFAGLALVAAFGAHDVLASPWCGGPTSTDRPQVGTGQTIHVAYVIPADGVDRFAERAPQISSDVDEVTAWWRTQDPEREPRFDLAPFGCGLQADTLTLRLSEDAQTLRPEPGRAERIEAAVETASGHSQWLKHLVYYDGPTDGDELCGQGGGSQVDTGVAIVYLQACAGLSTAVVAAHELLHALGALPASGPPHACPGDPGHPCDSPSDILFPFASATQLGALTLDVGHDDYYGHHSGAWGDLQTSSWLRLVHDQLRLGLTLIGTGSVTSDVPGLDCSSSCTTEWSRDSDLTLVATPGPGKRFVRWTGACAGEYQQCDLTILAASSITAIFAPERLRLVIARAGNGVVAGAGISCRAARCVKQAPSYSRLVLTARPARGWRFAGWTGACAGRRTSCSLPMERASAVRARFVRR